MNTELNIQLLEGVHNIFERSANDANRRIGETKEEKGDRLAKDGGYKCIHLSPESFVSGLSSVIERQKISSARLRNMKFLDVGCGVGEKVYLASLFGLKAFGLELRQELIDEGTQTLKSMGFGGVSYWQDENQVKTPKCFIQGNALDYNYCKFDILYFYCPLYDHDLQAKLERQIAKTAKKGAIVIPYLPHGCFAYSYGPKPLKGWQFISSNEDEQTDSNVPYFVKA